MAWIHMDSQKHAAIRYSMRIMCKPLWFCSGLVGHGLELGVVEQFAGQALALGFGLEQPLPNCN
jgi:hypothetical protein